MTGRPSSICPNCHQSTLLTDDERIYCMLCPYVNWINPRDPYPASSKRPPWPPRATVPQSIQIGLTKIGGS